MVERIEFEWVEPDELESLRAEMDLRVFIHLLQAQGGRGDVGPEHARGVRLKSITLAEIVTRIHYMLDAGWIDGGQRTIAGVADAALAPGLRQGLAEWCGDRCRGDVVRQVLEDDDLGRPVDPKRFVALRDDVVFYC